MKIITIIPARGGSKGIPRKNIIAFSGKPLLKYSVESSRNSKYISETYVTSDDQEILDLAEKLGAIPVKRPPDISGDDSTSESALKHVLSGLKDLPDVVCFLQATSPLRTTSDINSAIEKFTSDKLDSLFSACPIEDFFIWHHNSSGKLSSINYDFKNRKRRQDISSQIVENGSIYLFKPNILTKHNNRLGGTIGYSLMDPWKIYEIDSYDDLEMCEFLFEQRVK
mgnify:FL=1